MGGVGPSKPAGNSMGALAGDSAAGVVTFWPACTVATGTRAANSADTIRRSFLVGVLPIGCQIPVIAASHVNDPTRAMCSVLLDSSHAISHLAIWAWPIG